MDATIVGQSIIAEMAAEYNSIVDYLYTLHSGPGTLTCLQHIHRDIAIAEAQCAALMRAMRIVARQANINLKFNRMEEVEQTDTAPAPARWVFEGGYTYQRSKRR